MLLAPIIQAISRMASRASRSDLDTSEVHSTASSARPNQDLLAQSNDLAISAAEPDDLSAWRNPGDQTVVAYRRLFTRLNPPRFATPITTREF